MMMNGRASDQLLDVLERCMTACEKGAMEGLKGSIGEPLDHVVRLALDCAELCALAARFTARDSAYVNELLVLCAKMCRRCEIECRRHDLAELQQCADTCHECHLTCALVAQPN
jgi:hypothetical protein